MNENIKELIIKLQGYKSYQELFEDDITETEELCKIPMYVDMLEEINEYINYVENYIVAYSEESDDYDDYDASIDYSIFDN